MADELYSATFNNDGTTVVFTDQWGGGTSARCRATDLMEWGANAIYRIVDTPGGKTLEFASYYKLPVVQALQENCVSTRAGLVPVPGRDIVVQAWYQGGISMFEITDPASPVEIGYFDRGPISPTALVAGGFWSSYWYNGHVYGSELARGLDVLALVPTIDLSAGEIAAARQVVLGEHNGNAMRTHRWAPGFGVARMHRDRLVRIGGIDPKLLKTIDAVLDKGEREQDGPHRSAVAASLRTFAGQLTGEGQQALANAMLDLADSLN